MCPQCKCVGHHRDNHDVRTVLLWLRTSPCTSTMRIGCHWYQYQWSQCSVGGVRTGSLVKLKIWSLHHQICTSAIGMGIKWIKLTIWRCKDHIGSQPPSVLMCRVNPYFRTMLLMAHNQSLHLHIDDRIHVIPISMVPVQFWWCEDWNFVDENKSPVTAPPDLHRNHWHGYHMNFTINTEVQGLFRKSPALSINT